MKRAVLSLVVLLAAACGPRAPGVQAGQTYFWRVVSSDLAFGQCSDDAMFRMDLAPLAFQSNSYLIYQVDKTGKTAVSETCTQLQASSCKPSDSGVVFTVAGTELDFTAQAKTPLGSSGCQLSDTTTWIFTDLGETATLEISHVLNEVDNPMACATAEAQVKAQSPNMLGLEGCVVTFKVGLSMK